MSVPMILLLIAIGLIVVGVLLAVVGILKDDSHGLAAKPTLMAALIDMMKKCFKIITDPGANKWQKLSALGMLLVFLGVAFLISSAVAGILGDGSGSGSGSESPTPTPSASAT